MNLSDMTESKLNILISDATNLGLNVKDAIELLVAMSKSDIGSNINQMDIGNFEVVNLLLNDWASLDFNSKKIIFNNSAS
jgi:hypothetical protein